MTSKVCNKCGNEYPLTPGFWHKSNGYKDGFRQPCKACFNKLPIPKPGHKFCSKCKQEFPLTDEFWHKGSNNGFCAYCKKCNIERSGKWSKNNPEKMKVHRKNWRNANPEKERSASQAWKYAHADKHSDYNKRYRKDNPGFIALANRRRRVRKLNADGHHTRHHIKALYDFQEGHCFHCDCNISARYEVDHWIPLSRGGSNWPENLRLLCRFCNRSKGDKMPWEWHPEIYPNPEM